MIELTRCGAPDNDRYLPAVMTQGDASTYQTMIDNSTMQKRSQQMVDRAFGSAQSGTTQNGRQQGMAPSAVQGGAPPAAPDAVMGAQQIAPGLGPLPAAPNGMSVAEQILHSSWKSLMARNVGRSVIVSFLIGTQNTIVTHGILYEVGNDYIALYQPDEQSYISCGPLFHPLRGVSARDQSDQFPAATAAVRKSGRSAARFSRFPYCLHSDACGEGAERAVSRASPLPAGRKRLSPFFALTVSPPQRTSPSPSRISSERKDSAPHVAACGAASRSTVK